MIGLDNTTYTSNSINYVTTTFFHNLDSCIYSTGNLYIYIYVCLIKFRSTFVRQVILGHSNQVALLWLAKVTKPMTEDRAFLIRT